MKRIDYALPAGLSIGLAAVGVSAWMEGVNLYFLWQPAAALVVFGGTLGAIVIRRGVSGLRSAARACAGLCYRENTDELEATVARLAWTARAAKRDGVRVFEQQVATNRDPLVKQALMMAGEFGEPEKVRYTLERILDQEDEAGMVDAATLEAAGGYAPTFGILGAVLGLVHVLRSLADPASLGFGIATAFVATIYGVGIANLFLLPVAARLRERHAERMKLRELLLDALVALTSHETPSAITNRFSAHPSLNYPQPPATARTK